MAALEQGLKEALMKDGTRILEWLLNHSQPTVDGPHHGERHYKHRPKRVQSVLGEFQLRRDYYCGPQGGRAPLDEKLDLLESYTPGLQRLMCRAGAMDPSFEDASESLLIYAGINVPGRQIQRIVNKLGPKMSRWASERKPSANTDAIPVMYICYDGTGVPMVRKELAGRRGKQPDGTAKHREVKLGCVFTQHIRDEKGRPVRDPDSSTYVATFEKAEDFGGMIRQEAFRRGMARAAVVVVIGDGAEWIWNIARINFPFAVQILDFYHACEHLFSLCHALFADPAKAQDQFRKWRTSLKLNGVMKIIRTAQSLLDKGKIVDSEAVRSEIGYLQTNSSRMKYRTYKRKGYFIGSGVVEAGCKTVVGQRAKQSGMFWTVPGAENVLAIRCLAMGNSFEDYWKSRRTA